MAVFSVVRFTALLLLSVSFNIAKADKESKQIRKYSDGELFKLVKDMQTQIKRFEKSESSLKQSVSVLIDNAAQFRLQIEDLTKNVERLEKSDKEKEDRIAILENELVRIGGSNSDVNIDKQSSEHEVPKRNESAREENTTRVSGEVPDSKMVKTYRRGIRQTPEQVAFSAYLDHVIRNLGPDQSIVYNMVLLNEAGAYSGSTGIFHVPVSGVYLFSWSVTAIKLPGEYLYDIWVKLLVNGTHMVSAVAESRNDYEDNQGSNTVVLRLKQGDEVWTAHFGGKEIFGDDGGRTTSFSGVLLYQA